MALGLLRKMLVIATTNSQNYKKAVNVSLFQCLGAPASRPVMHISQSWANKILRPTLPSSRYDDIGSVVPKDPNPYSARYMLVQSQIHRRSRLTEPLISLYIRPLTNRRH